MIGLSLSFCIQDIVSGVIALDEVEKLITSTAWTEANLKERVEEYCFQYWSKHPEACKDVFYILWNTGRIEQPRLTHPYYIHFHARGTGNKLGSWWVEAPYNPYDYPAYMQALIKFLGE